MGLAILAALDQFAGVIEADSAGLFAGGPQRRGICGEWADGPVQAQGVLNGRLRGRIAEISVAVRQIVTLRAWPAVVIVVDCQPSVRDVWRVRSKYQAISAQRLSR